MEIKINVLKFWTRGAIWAKNDRRITKIGKLLGQQELMRFLN